MIQFHYFNQAHLIYLAGTMILAGVILALPLFYFCPKEAAGRILGFITIILTMLEIFYRVIYEGFTWNEALPLHFCGISLLMAGIYLVSRKDICFQITYYYAFGAVLALILPGIGAYRHPLYFQLFMLNHMLVIIGCAYAMMWLKARPSPGGLKVSIILTLLLCPAAYVYNSVYFTNFMFMNAYIMPQMSLIKPFWLYRASFILVVVLIMIGFYLPFRKEKALTIPVNKIMRRKG